MNYNNKTFRTISSSGNSETTTATIFNYKQHGNILTSVYKGGSITEGHLIGFVNPDGSINMNYHHINTNGVLMTGICTSTPEIQPNGKLKLYEHWQWTNGDCTKGTSTLEEI